MTTTNVSILKKDLASAIDRVIEYNETITINTKNGNAVLLSEDEYNSLIESAYLVSKKELIEKVKIGELEKLAALATYHPSEEW